MAVRPFLRRVNRVEESTLAVHKTAVARSAIAGDQFAHELTHDVLLDTGLRGDRPMQDTKGKQVYIETLTFYWIGEVHSVNFDFVGLSKVSKVLDNGRFDNCFQTGQFAEIETHPDPNHIHYIPIHCVCNYGEWTHALPAPTGAAPARRR